MKTITIPMSYYFKGSSNCSITINYNDKECLITLITDYGETLDTCVSGHGLARILHDLETTDKYT